MRVLRRKGSRLGRWKMKEEDLDDGSRWKPTQKIEAEGSRLRRWKLREADSDDVCTQRQGRE